MGVSTRALGMLQTFLGESTRRCRTRILLFSTLGIIVVKAGLTPSAIESMGITLNVSDRQFLLRAGGGIIAFNLLQFLIYASRDYLHFILGLPGTLEFKAVDTSTMLNPSESNIVNSEKERVSQIVDVITREMNEFYNRLASLLVSLVVCIDLLFPVAYGILACYFLFTSQLPEIGERIPNK